MRIPIASLFVAYAATAAGLLVTSPTKGEKVDLTKPLTIKWQSVSTDPSTFSIYLVNQNVYPPVQQLVVANMDSAKGHYTMKSMAGMDKGKGYQINFVSNNHQNGGILAQSQKFVVTTSQPPSAMSNSESMTMTNHHSHIMTTTSMTHGTMTTGTMTVTGSPMTTSNAAVSLVRPVQAGCFLLGLAALAL